jgi:hypothetical protein
MYGRDQEEQLVDGKVNLAEKLAQLDEPYVPGIIGYLSDYKVIVVKVLGKFVWHKHDNTDGFFLVLRGHLTIQLSDRDIELREGEMFVVPRGVEHARRRTRRRTCSDRATGDHQHRRRGRRPHRRTGRDLG